MGPEQYVSHDWSYVTFSLMLLGVVVVVFATMGLFLWMVHRAGQTPSRATDAAARDAVMLESSARATDLPPRDEQAPAA